MASSVTYRRKPASSLDQSKLTMYDMENNGAFVSENSAGQYPDWTEQGTFVITGPLGSRSKHPGVAFPSLDEACQVYGSLYGEPVEADNVLVSDKVKTMNIGSKYMLRFKGKRDRALERLAIIAMVHKQ